MKRCNACFRYAVGKPTYCPHCGRSYEVRLCPRGHASPRNVQFCSICGSGDLSTPAPPEDVLARASRWLLVFALYAFGVIAAGSVGVALIASLDLRQLAGPLFSLAVMWALLYWTSTLVPGPIKKVGRAAGRRAWRAIKGGRERP
jgi:hypothetical protein